RFHLVRTAEGNLPLVGPGVSAPVAAELLAVASDEPPFDGSPAPMHRERYIELLGREAPVARETAGPGYVLPDDLRAPAGAVRITRENAGLLEPHFADWFAHQGDPLHYLDSRSPVVASVEDGVAASLCMCARLASPGIE